MLESAVTQPERLETEQERAVREREESIAPYERRNPFVEMFVGTAKGHHEYTRYARKYGFTTWNPLPMAGYLLRQMHRLSDLIGEKAGVITPRSPQDDDTSRRLLDLHRRLTTLENLAQIKAAIKTKKVLAKGKAPQPDASETDD